MLTFKEFLLEDKQGKNLHLEHLEDEILNFGVGGGRGAINFLQSLRDMLSGSSKCCLLYTSPSPRDGRISRMPSSA